MPEPEIEQVYTVPLLFNDPAATSALKTAQAAVLGEDKVIDRPAVMGAHPQHWRHRRVHRDHVAGRHIYLS